MDSQQEIRFIAQDACKQSRPDAKLLKKQLNNVENAFLVVKTDNNLLRKQLKTDNEENEELINVLQVENRQLIEKNLKLESDYNNLLQEANLNNELIKCLMQINYKI